VRACAAACTTADGTAGLGPYPEADPEADPEAEAAREGVLPDAVFTRLALPGLDRGARDEVLPITHNVANGSRVDKCFTCGYRCSMRYTFRNSVRRLIQSANQRSMAGALLLCAIVVLMVGCERAGKSLQTADGPKRLSIVTTTGMIADVARNIGGDFVSVHALMGEGVDPHLYKPSPGDIRMLGEADLVLYNGLHLEGRMGDVIENLGKSRPVVPVADGIDRSKLRSPPEFEGQHDPHVWFDVQLWRQATAKMLEAMSKADPANATTYQVNTARYAERLMALDNEARTRIASIPVDRRVLITAHDAFGYFGRAYGIEVLAIQGVSTDSEAGLKDINRLVDVIVARKIPAVFIESSVPRKTIDALIEGANSRGQHVVVGGELFSDAMGKDGTDEGTYIGMVRHNLKVIIEGLLGGPAHSPTRKDEAGTP